MPDIQAQVTYNGRDIYPALIDPTTDAIEPLFGLADVCKIADATQAEAKAAGGVGDTIEVVAQRGRPTLVIRNIGHLYYEPPADEDSLAYFTPDENGLYGICGKSWNWQIVTDRTQD